MRISDWSSDVCSSDLHADSANAPMQKSVETARGHPRGGHRHQRIGLNIGIADPDTAQEKGREKGAEAAHPAHEGCDAQEAHGKAGGIGRASVRDRGGRDGEIEMGVGTYIKKK